LPDFSYAGYRAGARAIPDLPVKINVRDFGAVGDGLADDTTAFLRAIEAVREGAILIPRGRYRITAMLRVRKRGVVLRGEGEDQTVLFFPKPLAQTAGSGKAHAPGESWSWSGGYLSFEGWDVGSKLGEVTSSARRGDKLLTVSEAGAMMPGQWIRLLLTDTDGSLARHLHADQADGAKAYHGRNLVDFASPIESVDGDKIVLARPLRTDVRLNWRPAVWAMDPSVQEVGVESLAIEFPEQKYAGHHDEPGYNAVSFEAVSNGWLRRVRIVNADSGVFLRNRTKFCTVQFLHFLAGPGRMRTGYGRDKGEPAAEVVGGHHGILAEGFAQDNLVSDFQLDYRFIHDTSVSAWSVGNVFSRGRGIDLNFDHHRRAPHENLFTQIEAGQGARLWQRGGDESDGPPSGARETFWNVRAQRHQVPPSWGLQGNFVGVATQEPSRLSADGNWWEAVDSARLTPANLYEAQRRNRLGR